MYICGEYTFANLLISMLCTHMVLRTYLPTYLSTYLPTYQPTGSSFPKHGLLGTMRTSVVEHDYKIL